MTVVIPKKIMSGIRKKVRLYMGRKRNEKILSMFLSLIILMGVAFAPTIGVEAEDANPKRVVRVGYYSAPGFQNYDEETGEYSGSSYEYLLALKQYTNWEYEFVPVEFADGVQMLQNGELDLMNNVSKTPEREETLSYSDYSSDSNYGCLIVRSDDTTYAYNDFQSYGNMKVGLLHVSIFNDYFFDFCREQGISPEVVYYGTDEEVMAAMGNGEIDARVVSSSYQDGSRVLAKFAPMDYYLAVPKGQTDLLHELNDAMVSVETNMPNLQQELDGRYAIKYVEDAVILSDAEKAYLAEHPKVNVAVSDVGFPISYFAEGDVYAGPLSDIYHEIEKATGVTFVFEKYGKYEDALQAVSDGKSDMIAEFPFDLAFADKWNVDLTDMVKQVEIYSVVNEKYYVGSVQKVALYGNSYLTEQIKKVYGEIYGDQVTYDTYNTMDEAVEAVLAGEADCTFLNQYAVSTYQNRGKYFSLHYVQMPELEYSFGLGISMKAAPELKTIIGKGLMTFDQDYYSNLFQMTAEMTAVPDLEAQIYQNPALFVIICGTLLALIVLIITFFIYRNRMNKKNLELQRAREAQSDFLSRMSHDMRTPMNGILGLSYLMETEPDIHKVKEYIPKLQKSSNYLLQLINDVLDVNKIESGNLTLAPKACDEKQVFDSILELMEPLFDEKHIDFHFEKINIKWQYMMIDEQRVKQIFVNLLNNAVKFTPEGGRIDLIMELVSKTDDMVRDRFIIRDTGIGISEDFLPHIFEPFRQEARTNMGYTAGTGLGLSIVKQLVEMMGGNISVESKVGKGTEFTLYVNFPLAKRVDELQASVDREASEEAAAKGEQILEPGLGILLCEDHPLNASIAIKLLERQSAVVTWAHDGAEGLELFEASEEGTYDVVLMDIRMPVMDGLEATRRIRGLDRMDAGRVPIIAMSANAYEADVERSMEAGMNAHLAKPVEPQVMYKEIRRCVEEIGEESDD